MTDRPIDPTDRPRPTANSASVKALVPASTDRPTTPSVDPEPTIDVQLVAATGPTDRDRTVDEPESYWLRVGLTIALWSMSTVASLMAANGQLGFADWAHVHGLDRYGVPVILELFAVILLFLGYRQGRRRRSPYPLWAIAGVVGGFAMYTNIVHAGPRAGLVFGAATAAAMIAWFVKLRIDLTHYLERIGAVPPGRPKFGKLALVAPRVALHCWTVTVRRRVTDGDKAVECAETWIVVFDDTYAALRDLGSPRMKARRLAKRTAWHQIFAMTNGPKIAMPQSALVETVAVTIASTEPTGAPVDRPQPPQPPRVAPTAAPIDEWPTVDLEESITDRPAVADRPQRSAAARRPVERSAGGHSPAAIANARLLREQYHPNGLPANYSYGQVRGDTGWSFERTKAAVDAYRDGADLDDGADEPDRELAIA